MIHREGCSVGQGEHVEELHGGPEPAVRFAADDGDGGCALHGEGEEDHQRQRAAEGHVVVQSGLQVERLRAGVGAVKRSHGADHDFARQHAREQADADLPVEAERRNGRLDEVAETADERVSQLRSRERARGGVDDGQMRENPERESDGDDDGSGGAHEDARAVHEAQAEREREWACGTAAARG